MEGKVVTRCGVRVLRKGKVVHVGVLDSLRRVKEIVKEVRFGKVIYPFGLRSRSSFLHERIWFLFSLFGYLKSFVVWLRQVNAGLECGIGVEDFDDWEEGDRIEAFNTVEKRRTLEEASASIAAALEGGVGL